MQMAFRTIVAALGAGFLFTSAAWAADFSHADCASPAFKAFMHARLGHGKLEQTDRLSPDRFNFGQIVKASTVSRSAGAIICEISVDLAGQGGTHQIHGRFTATQNGWRWQPAY